MAIPADLLEEVGIDLYSTIQMSVSRGRIIIEPVAVSYTHLEVYKRQELRRGRKA